LVAAAARPEHGDRARVRILQLDLCEARIIARPLVKVQHRRMTCVAEDDTAQLSLWIAYRQHRHIMIDRPLELTRLLQLGDIGLLVVTPIDRERRLADAP